MLQVRGILNKLTPEKFEKLINDVLNVGLDSSTILKGVIVLVSTIFSIIRIFRQINIFFLFFGRFLKKPSMSRNIRLCMHNCADFSSKKLPILNHQTPQRALSKSCCSKSVVMNLKIAPKSLNSTKKWPPETVASTRTRRTRNTWPSARCSATSSSWVRIFRLIEFSNFSIIRIILIFDFFRRIG